MRCRRVLCALVLCSLAYGDDIVKGDFDLIDQRGQSVTEHSFDGKLRLVFFGFTRCPDICPTTLFEVARAMRRLGDDASNVQPIFISVAAAPCSAVRLLRCPMFTAGTISIWPASPSAS